MAIKGSINYTEPAAAPKRTASESHTPSSLEGRRIGRPTKLGLLWSFSGKNYRGLQIQTEHTETVEHAMLEAIRAAGVTREGDSTLHDIEWTRASRTDAGVSAARIVTSATLAFSPDLVERINAHLPADIRLQGAVRVTRAFNGRHQASSRAYEYLLPVEALRPVAAFSAHAQRYADACAARGWAADPALCIPGTPEECAAWEFGPADAARLERILQRFVGWHHYHNYCRPGLFTESDPQVHREIMSWKVSGPVVRGGVPLLVCRVHGRSFIHSQIRRMIGTAVVVARGMAPPEFITAALDREVHCNTAFAPGLGLLLDRVWFDAYERRNPSHPDLRFEDANSAVEEWKEKNIYAAIGETEAQAKAFMTWLRADVELVRVEDFWNVALRHRLKLENAKKEAAAALEAAQAGAARAVPDQ